MIKLQKLKVLLIRNILQKKKPWQSQKQKQSLNLSKNLKQSRKLNQRRNQKLQMISMIIIYHQTKQMLCARLKDIWLLCLFHIKDLLNSLNMNSILTTMQFMQLIIAERIGTNRLKSLQNHILVLQLFPRVV